MRPEHRDGAGGGEALAHVVAGRHEHAASVGWVRGGAADACERLGQVGRQRRVDCQRRAGPRVGEGDVARVQREPREAELAREQAIVLGLAVARVADDGARQVLQVAADSVGAPGVLGCASDERIAAAEHPQARERRDRLALFAALILQWMIDAHDLGGTPRTSAT